MNQDIKEYTKFVQFAEKQKEILVTHNKEIKEKERKLTLLVGIILALWINALRNINIGLKLKFVHWFLGIAFLFSILAYAIIVVSVFYWKENITYTDPSTLIKLVNEITKELSEASSGELLDFLYLEELDRQIIPILAGYTRRLQIGLQFLIAFLFLIVIFCILFTLSLILSPTVIQ